MDISKLLLFLALLSECVISVIFGRTKNLFASMGPDKEIKDEPKDDDHKAEEVKKVDLAGTTIFAKMSETIPNVKVEYENYCPEDSDRCKNYIANYVEKCKGGVCNELEFVTLTNIRDTDILVAVAPQMIFARDVFNKTRKENCFSPKFLRFLYPGNKSICRFTGSYFIIMTLENSLDQLLVSEGNSMSVVIKFLNLAYARYLNSIIAGRLISRLRNESKFARRFLNLHHKSYLKKLIKKLTNGGPHNISSSDIRRIANTFSLYLLLNDKNNFNNYANSYMKLCINALIGIADENKISLNMAEYLYAYPIETKDYCNGDDNGCIASLQSYLDRCETGDCVTLDSDYVKLDKSWGKYLKLPNHVQARVSMKLLEKSKAYGSATMNYILRRRRIDIDGFIYYQFTLNAQKILFDNNTLKLFNKLFYYAALIYDHQNSMNFFKPISIFTSSKLIKTVLDKIIEEDPVDALDKDTLESYLDVFKNYLAKKNGVNPDKVNAFIKKLTDIISRKYKM